MIERNLSERYRLEGRIGQGGMASVYAGFDTVLRRRVAIKVLRPQFAADEDFVKRFYTEAQHAAKLSHPNVVNIYDVGHEGETYFIVMELVDGTTLGEMIESDTRLPEAIAIDFAQQICNGLGYAHRQGLLHRDIKPANILITKDDVVKLSDFGIARAVSTQTVTVTQPGLVMGSVYYISPEQAQGHELRESSDLYSLGVVLFQMLTGKLPYTGESPITVALKHVSNPIPPLEIEDGSISPALCAIVRKLMQKDPAERFGSAMEVAKALREAREHPLVTTPFDVASNGTSEAAAERFFPNPKPRPSKVPERFVAAQTTTAEQAKVATRKRRAPAPSLSAPVIALLALVLVAAIGIGYLVSRPGGILGGPSSLAVANVVGRTADDAEKSLVGAGLAYKLVPIASETVAQGRVVRQEPAAGSAVPGRSVVALYVSTGLPTVDLIDVRQYSIDDAERYLRAAKLVPKIAQRYDKNAPKGTVLGQSPEPGTRLPVRSSVSLVVSQGPQPVGVPDVVTLLLSDATRSLAAKGLKLEVSERVASDTIPPDVIVSQSPAAGSPVAPGSTVAVNVSLGAPQLSVPDVGGRLAADAASALQIAGLQASTEYVVDASTPLGTVMQQDPPAGTTVRKGSKVTLDVAVPGIVPDVAGMTPAQAQTTLQNAGYQIGNTAYVQEGQEGKVVRTEPGATSPLRPGETVTLYVSGVSPQ
ncbi:MAG: Stk1 family PASTA domain-containing Ser/Thr kinase [Vulcanimicrobiaceae bacterium]